MKARSRTRDRAFDDASVAATFATCPRAIRTKLLALRRLIFETAASIGDVGRIEETLKWGEPAYLTSRTGSGTTIRIGWKQAKPTQFAMYVNCQTDLIETFRTLFGDELRFEGNRAIVFDQRDALPQDVLRVCIEAALTYHRRRRKSG